MSKLIGSSRAKAQRAFSVTPELSDDQTLRLIRERRRRSAVVDEGLLDFVPRITPSYSRPNHLTRYAGVLEVADEQPIRTLVSMPPRHGKTELILHAIAYLLRKNPATKIGYASYSAQLARSKSARARTFAMRAGVALSESVANLEEWRTDEGGGLIAQGIGGGWTGHGVDVLIVDDPVKNRVEAESPTYRNRVLDWYRDVAYTRLEPGGSVIVNMTRWHREDLIGVLAKDEMEGFEKIVYRALDDEENPLWPERFSQRDLLRLRSTLGPYGWASLYQQEPRPRGGAVFEGTYYYDKLPDEAYRAAGGVDLAYTAKTRADYSVIVILLRYGRGDTAKYYVLDVVRKQCKAPDFIRDLKAANRDFPGSPLLFLYGGTERGVLDFLKKDKVKIKGAPASGDKFVRSQPVAAAWAEGRVLVPRKTCDNECQPDCDEHPAPDWVEGFLDEVLEFTGTDGETDDQVDALAAAFTALDGKSVSLVSAG